jgi:catechol 2,3-dioxygenase-like lactoylglutathione lyase family enzyme
MLKETAMTDDIYPMPSFPILMVGDLEASARFYQDVLGFRHIFSMPGPGSRPALVHLRWVKYADLLITRPRDGLIVPEPRGAGITLNFNLFDRFEGNIDAFAEHARQNGANVAGPVAQPWNVREVTVVDPDGYRLVFTAPINVGLGLDTVVERVKGGDAGQRMEPLRVERMDPLRVEKL